MRPFNLIPHPAPNRKAIITFDNSHATILPTPASMQKLLVRVFELHGEFNGRVITLVKKETSEMGKFSIILLIFFHILNTITFFNMNDNISDFLYEHILTRWKDLSLNFFAWNSKGFVRPQVLCMQIRMKIETSLTECLLNYSAVSYFN